MKCRRGSATNGRAKWSVEVEGATNGRAKWSVDGREDATNHLAWRAKWSVDVKMLPMAVPNEV